MAAAASMDPHDRRLSVSKSSSFKLSAKPSSSHAPPLRPSPLPSSNSRPPPTLIHADLANFRRVVQEHTGTPPASASSSPSPTARSSRLKQIAPPSLRSLLQQQNQYPQQQLHQFEPPQTRHQDVSNSPILHQLQHSAARAGHADDQLPHHDFSWLKSAVGLFSPPLPYTQVANFNQNSSGSAFNIACNTPSPRPLLLSPHQFAAAPTPTTATESMWANLMHALPSPNGSPLLPLPSNRHPPLAATSNAHTPPFSPSSVLLSPSSYTHPQLRGPALPQAGSPLLPSPSGVLPPLLPASPSTAFLNPWLTQWPPSPLLPLPFSPAGLFPPSPGLSSFISSPRGFTFYGTHDHQSKLP